MSSRSSALFLLVSLALVPATARSESDYQAADTGRRGGSGTLILPEKMLRGYDPVTVYFERDTGQPGPDDNGAKTLSIEPAWPGAWMWIDRKTLQFRPAEPWPALARFSAKAAGQTRILATLMQPPSSTSPDDGSSGLAPFRSVSFTFPQALSLDSLRRMLAFEVREAPGLADSPKKPLKGFELAAVPRADHRSPATYVVTFPDAIPEGRVLVMTAALALGDGGTNLWTGRLSTRAPFELLSLSCGYGQQLDLRGGRMASKEVSLACDQERGLPTLVFSDSPAPLTLSDLKRLVRLEPSVPDLDLRQSGNTVELLGSFQPDVLYRVVLHHQSFRDSSGRTLATFPDTELYFYLGWRKAYLRWDRSNVILESKGPRMVPLTGYGDARADVRIHRIDPLHNGLWPFPASPVIVDEESAPPFPGEEPQIYKEPLRRVEDVDTLVSHVRLLGSPLVSRVVDLPKAAATRGGRFGLDVGPLLDEAVGANKPGTYLVGLRRLDGTPHRAWVRVHVTNLSLTTLAERTRMVVYVRTLDTAQPVKGATLRLEGTSVGPYAHPVEITVTADASGRAEIPLLSKWASLERVTLASDDDVLVLDPDEAPPAFASDHWSPGGDWFDWLLQTAPDRSTDGLRAFAFTERPVYKPGESVFVKAFLRAYSNGHLRSPGDVSQYFLEVEGPDGNTRSLETKRTGTAGFSAEFKEDDGPTGDWTARLVRKKPYEVLATRTFKVEAYRLPTFEVQVTGPTVARLDAPFSVKAIARYFAGGLVSGAPVQWTITRRPTYHVPAGMDGFLFASSTQFSRPGGASGPQQTSVSAVLGDDGTQTQQVNPAIDPDGTPRIYRFEATVTGADDQQVTSSTEVTALPPFVLGLQVERFLDGVKALEPRIVAVGVDDKPLAGQQVTVRLYRRVWNSTLRETNFSTGEAKYVTEREDRKVEERTVVSAATPIPVKFDLKEAGVYLIELEARDKLGRVQVLQADLYAAGPGAVAWQKPKEGVFTVTPDKAQYAPGDVAKLVLQSPFQKAVALVVVERPERNDYVVVDVVDGKATLPVQITPDVVPNVPVHVILQRGRIGSGPGDDSRVKPQTLGASLDLEVEPQTNKVFVKLEHPESARPTTTVDVTVKLADEKGKALSGEVTLWLVDEAALSLGREGPLDPLVAMIRRNPRELSIRDTRNTIVGRLLGLDETPGGDGSDEEDLLRGKLAIRRNFKTVPYYAATLDVPASGVIKVPIALADDLTNFRIGAVASSGWERFGVATSRLRVRLPVLVQAAAPRFVRSGDRVYAGALARVVEGPDGDAVVQLEVTGPAKAGETPRQAKLDALKPARFEVPIEVGPVAPRENAQLVLRAAVKRKVDGAGDAVEVKLPVRLDRSVERFAKYLTLKPGATPLPGFPMAPRPGTHEFSVSATNVPGLLSVVAGLESLSTTPHQSLATRISKLLPALEQGAFLGRLGMEAYAAEATKHARRLVDELATYQDDTGLFGDWPGTPGSEQVTAWAMEFIQAARRQGLTLDPKLEERAAAGLARVLRSDWPGFYETLSWSQRVAALRGLALSGRIDQPYARELFDKRPSLDTEAVANLSEALLREPRTYSAELQSLRTFAWDRVIFQLHEGKPQFKGLQWGGSRWWPGWLSTETSTTAQLLNALVQLTPADQRLILMRDALVLRADPVLGYGSAYENRYAIRAIGTWLDVAQVTGTPATISFGAQGSIKLDKGRELQTFRTALADKLTATVDGAAVDVRVAATYLPAEPGWQAKPSGDGFVVSRSYTLYRGSEEPRGFPDEAGAVRELKIGDILELHTRIETPVERYHVALVVPFAAAAEPLDPTLATAPPEAKTAESDSLRPTYVQRLDDETRYVFSRLPAGTHAFHQRVRITTRGEFTHPSPWAEQIYLPGPFGRGAGQKFTVTAAE